MSSMIFARGVRFVLLFGAVVLAAVAVPAATAGDEEPVQADSTEAPAFSNAPPVDPPPPAPVSSNDPNSPDEVPAPPSPCLGPVGESDKPCNGPEAPIDGTTSGVTWSSNADAVQFRNADGVWTIYKRCHDATVNGLRSNVGPGYIAKLVDSSGRTLVNDFRPRTNTNEPGYLNAGNGGLGTFGWHHTRGPVNATPAGDDPTTPTVEQPVDRAAPGYAVEGGMCAPSNAGYGVFARSWAGPIRISSTQVQFTIDVWLRDAQGATGYGVNGNALARIRYRYSFFRSSVRTWISVLLYPRTDAGGVPFVKEPKVVTTIRGGDFTRMAIFKGSDPPFLKGVMLGAPEGSTGLRTDHTDDPARVRVRWDYGTSTSAPGDAPCANGYCFNVVMRSYPTTADGNILRTCADPAVCSPVRVPAPWEGAGLGLDAWAVASASRVKTWPRDTYGHGVVSSCSVQPTPQDDLNGDGSYAAVELSYVSERSTPAIDSVRRWEHGGFKASVPVDPNNNRNPYTSSSTGFMGWEGAAGPGDCEPLERALPTQQESWGTFGIYSVGDGWERLQ